MPQGDAPPRRPPCSTCPPRCVLPFLFCCLLIDRVATVRSVDFAAEESVVAPPGGAPGTPAGYCWLLDVSLRRMARSGWTCGVAMTTMMYETYKDSRSRSYVHRPFAFLFSCWCRRTTAWRWRPRRAARACAGGGTGNVRERGYHVLLSYSLLNTRTPTRHDTAHSHAHALALKRDTAKQAGGAFPSAAGGVQPKHCLLKDVV